MNEYPGILIAITPTKLQLGISAPFLHDVPCLPVRANLTKGLAIENFIEVVAVVIGEQSIIVAIDIGI